MPSKPKGSRCSQEKRGIEQMVEEKAAEISEYYARQVSLYKEMLAIAQELKALCSAADFAGEEDLKELNALLFKRQKIMDQIEASQQKVQVLKKSLQEELSLAELNIKVLCRYLSPHRSSLLLSLVGQIEALLKEIADLDCQIQGLFLAKLDTVRQELGQVRKRKKANQAYRPLMQQREGFFIDRNK